MKPESLRSRYRDMMDRLVPSADPAIEALRWRWASGELSEEAMAPEKFGELSANLTAGASAAFHDFERNGFLEHNYRHYLWRNPSRTATALVLDTLAGIEIAVMLRAHAIDLAKVQPELDHRYDEILRLATASTSLPVTLALQRYFATLVVSIGSDDLLSEYAKLNKVAVCYAWAHHLDNNDTADLRDWITLLPGMIATGGGRETARLCQAIKCLPLGAQLPALAIA